jgi:hypothetical protein
MPVESQTIIAITTAHAAESIRHIAVAAPVASLGLR